MQDNVIELDIGVMVLAASLAPQYGSCLLDIKFISSLACNTIRLGYDLICHQDNKPHQIRTTTTVSCVRR